MAKEAARRITVEEYFALLQASPTKLDFIDGRVIDPLEMEANGPAAMAGGKIRHGLIPLNVARARTRDGRARLPDLDVGR